MNESQARSAYDKAALAMKVVMLVNAIALIVLPSQSAIYFETLSFNVLSVDKYADYDDYAIAAFICVCLLMALSGAIIIASEFSPKARRLFYFLQPGYGKGVALICICPLLLLPFNFIGVAFAAWLLLCGVAFCILSCVYRKDEAAALSKLLTASPEEHPIRISAAAYDIIALILKAMSFTTVVMVAIFLQFPNYYNDEPLEFDKSQSTRVFYQVIV